MAEKRGRGRCAPATHARCHNASSPRSASPVGAPMEATSQPKSHCNWSACPALARDHRSLAGRRCTVEASAVRKGPACTRHNFSDAQMTKKCWRPVGAAVSTPGRVARA
eukprot:3700466-Prymnesium_polylepis.1